MKLIMERWDQFVEENRNPLALLLENRAEALEDLKKDPKQAAALVQQAAKEKDKEKLKQLVGILLADPEVKAAAQVIAKLPAEVEKQEKEAEKPPDLTEIEFLDKLSRQVGASAVIGADEILDNPVVKKIMPLGGVTLLLGTLLAALTGNSELATALFSGAGVAASCAAGGADCISSIIDGVAGEASGADMSAMGRVGQQ